MKRLTILLVVLAISVTGLNAQNPLQKGGKQLNAGVGFSDWGIPLYFGMDFGVHPDISLGFQISHRSYDEDWDNDHYDHTIWGFSGNANYHFNTILNIPSEWDFYAGLNLGFYAWSSHKDYPGDHTSGLGLGAQIGGRYFFNNNLGVNLEFGGGNAFNGGKFGITYQF